MTEIKEDIEDTELLSKLQRYLVIGRDARSSWQADRLDAEAVWEGTFRNDPDEDVFYYPMMYALLRHYVRAVRKTYMSATDIVSVDPLARKASQWEVRVAEYQQEEINYHLHRFNDFLTFLDDTATQCTKIGICFAKVWWDQVRESEEVEVPTGEIQYDFDENGELVENPQTRKEKRERIVRNKLMIDWVGLDDISFDTSAKKWSDVDWVIHENIEYTPDELMELAETDPDWNQAAVERLLENYNPEDNENPETTPIKTAEFWGKIALPEEDPLDGTVFKRTKFVKICFDMDSTEILAGPVEPYKYADTGEPMINFSAGYFVRREGEIRGDSYCNKLKNYQAENNSIRNQRRKSVENDLNEKYVYSRDAELEFEQLEGGSHGTLMSVAGPVSEGFREVRHWDNTGSSYNEIEAVRRDVVEMTGISEYALGMVDAHMTDTLGGMQLMSTASNAVIYDNILSYNMFLEDLLTKGLHLSLQYLTVEELRADGVELPADITREDMKRSLKLRLDTGQGATSEQVELNNLMKAYFITQNFMQYCVQYGIEPGEARYYPSVLLKKMLPLLNVKDADIYIPEPKMLQKNTEDMLEFMQQQQQAAQAQAQQGRAEEMEAQGVIDAMQNGGM